MCRGRGLGLYNTKKGDTLKILLSILACFFAVSGIALSQEKKPRFRESGFSVGVLSPGYLNAITDVKGVLVGHTTLMQGDNIRTGVTAILPHSGNLYKEKVPAAIFIGNAFGKLAGSTQVNELGEIETPILLTSTLNVPRVADAVLDYMLSLPGNEKVQSINVVVAETNDGILNDIRQRFVKHDHVIQAIKNAKTGAVEEGSIGAGTGTIAFGYKGGIGTSSRILPPSLGGYTIGVLVQTNFGGVLSIAGKAVGEQLGRYYLRNQLEEAKSKKYPIEKNDLQNNADGSVIIVIATDAPVDARNLKRLAARAMLGLGRTGAAGTNGSGDYVIAFSTAPEIRIHQDDEKMFRNFKVLSNEAMSPLFLAVIEATEEAIYNSLFQATTMMGRGVTVEELPIQQVSKMLKKDK